MSRLFTAVLLMSVASASQVSARLAFQVDSIEVDVVQVADSGSYYVYSYTITNPPASTWAVSAVKLNIASASGTPANLPSTGQLVDATAALPGDPHAEVGPVAPSGWTSILTRGAELWWGPQRTAVSTSDSIGPGATMGGFGIRSSYLPGINTVTAEPTVEACCLSPVSGADGVWYPSPTGFPTVGHSAIPRYQPSEVDLDLIQSQLGTVCTDPLWIDDTPLCAELTDSLDVTQSRLSSSDNAGARSALESVLAILDAEREPAGAIEDNAYWLLQLNVAHVLSTILGGPITVAGAGDTYLRQGTPNQNQGDENVLSIRASGRHRVLIEVDDGQLQALSGPIASAVIELDIVLNAGNWGTAGRPIDVHRMLVPWTEGGATWNCADDLEPGDPNPDCPATEWEMFTLDPSPYAPTASATLLVTGGLTGTVSFDVTADVQAMIAGQVPSHGWIIRKTDEGDPGRIEFASREAGNGPRLMVVPGSE